MYICLFVTQGTISPIAALKDGLQPPLTQLATATTTANVFVSQGHLSTSTQGQIPTAYPGQVTTLLQGQINVPSHGQITTQSQMQVSTPSQVQLTTPSQLQVATPSHMQIPASSVEQVLSPVPGAPVLAPTQLIVGPSGGVQQNTVRSSQLNPQRHPLPPQQRQLIEHLVSQIPVSPGMTINQLITAAASAHVKLPPQLQGKPVQQTTEILSNTPQTVFINPKTNTVVTTALPMSTDGSSTGCLVTQEAPIASTAPVLGADTVASNGSIQGSLRGVRIKQEPLSSLTTLPGTGDGGVSYNVGTHIGPLASLALANRSTSVIVTPSNIKSEAIQALQGEQIAQNLLPGQTLANQTLASQTLIHGDTLQAIQNLAASGQISTTSNPLQAGHTLASRKTLQTGQTIVTGTPLHTGHTLLTSNPLQAGHTLSSGKNLQAGQTIVTSDPLQTEHILSTGKTLQTGQGIVTSNPLQAGHTLFNSNPQTGHTLHTGIGKSLQAGQTIVTGTTQQSSQVISTG